MDLFQAYSLRQSIQEKILSGVTSFVSVAQINPPVYYVMNYLGKNIHVYNEFWEFQRTISVSYKPSYSINNNGVIYVTTDFSIYKYDKYLNLIKKSTTCEMSRGIYFNRIVYVACSGALKIKKFDENLISNGLLQPVYQPWFITGYNSQMVVGGNNNGSVYFYQNNAINKTISTKCTGRVSSILFDTYNHMLVLCETNNYLYIYDSYGTFTGISISTCNKPTSMNFDSKDRLVITCNNQIDIYY
jgi:hypothetical protein